MGRNRLFYIHHFCQVSDNEKFNCNRSLHTYNFPTACQCSVNKHGIIY